MKFRKKPIVVEANQFFPEHEPWPRGVFGFIPPNGYVDTYFARITQFRLNVLEGQLRIYPGDWIITGIKGDRYPCKPDVFDATYEPVLESEDSE